MAGKDPMAELQPQFSSDDATPTAWAEARERLEQAEVYWLATVRPDGRPHVTPVIAVWQDGALYFCTGPGERKAKNLARNLHCVITTGCNALNEGLDLVVEGDAETVSDEARLQRLADGYASKYDWHFTVRDGAFYGDGGSPGVQSSSHEGLRLRQGQVVQPDPLALLGSWHTPIAGALRLGLPRRCVGCGRPRLRLRGIQDLPRRAHACTARSPS